LCFRLLVESCAGRGEQQVPPATERKWKTSLIELLNSNNDKELVKELQRLAHSSSDPRYAHDPRQLRRLLANHSAEFLNGSSAEFPNGTSCEELRDVSPDDPDGNLLSQSFPSVHLCTEKVSDENIKNKALFWIDDWANCAADEWNVEPTKISSLVGTARDVLDLPASDRPAHISMDRWQDVLVALSKTTLDAFVYEAGDGKPIVDLSFVDCSDAGPNDDPFSNWPHGRDTDVDESVKATHLKLSVSCDKDQARIEAATEGNTRKTVLYYVPIHLESKGEEESISQVTSPESAGAGTI